MSLPLVRRTRYAALALASAAPLIVALAACGSDSATSPHSAPGVDTIAVDPTSYEQVEYYGQHGVDSSYYSQLSYAGEADVGFYAYTPNGYFSEDRALMGFTLPTLAGRGVVDSAKAIVWECGTSVASLGPVLLDHVHFGDALNDSLAFLGDSLQNDVGTVTSDTITGFHSVTVTSSVQGDYSAKRQDSEYRMRFVPTVPLTGSYNDYIYFGEYGCNGGSLPFLVIWSH